MGGIPLHSWRRAPGVGASRRPAVSKRGLRALGIREMACDGPASASPLWPRVAPEPCLLTVFHCCNFSSSRIMPGSQGLVLSSGTCVTGHHCTERGRAAARPAGQADWGDDVLELSGATAVPVLTRDARRVSAAVWDTLYKLAPFILVNRTMRKALPLLPSLQRNRNTKRFISS